MSLCLLRLEIKKKRAVQLYGAYLMKNHSMTCQLYLLIIQQLKCVILYMKRIIRKNIFQNCVDNLNLLYVAFTRASKNLFIFGKKRN